MTDTKRTTNDLLNNILHDGQTAGISANDIRDVVVSYNNIYDYGWSSHHDAQYTSGSPLVIPSGGRAALTSDDLGTLFFNNQRPQSLKDAGQVGFYNTTTDKIEVNNIGLDDILDYRITVSALPQNANVIMRMEFQIEDTPPVIIGTETITFPDGAARQVGLTTKTFILQNFIDSGAKIYIAAEGGSISVYDYRLLITRSYIAP